MSGVLDTVKRWAGGVALRVSALIFPGATVGHVLTVVDDDHGGTEVVPRAPSGGGGAASAHTSGTLAALPASPAAGDSYRVTSGAGVDTVYYCFIDGDWNPLVRAGAAIDMDGARINHLDDPSADDDAATKGYVDAAMSGGGAPVSLGTAYNAGNARYIYLEVAGGTPTAAPIGGPGETLVFMFVPVVVPVGPVEIVACHMDPGAGRGWELRLGENAGDRCRFSIFFPGLTFGGSGIVSLPGATFAGALNVPHILALTVTPGGEIHYAWDAVVQTPITGMAGTHSPPLAGDYFIWGGRPVDANYPAIDVQFVQMRTYSTVLSDADLAAVAATRMDYVLADPAAGTLTSDISASAFVGRGSVLDRANPAARWRVVGALLAHERV